MWRQRRLNSSHMCGNTVGVRRQTWWRMGRFWPDPARRRHWSRSSAHRRRCGFARIISSARQILGLRTEIFRLGVIICEQQKKIESIQMSIATKDHPRIYRRQMWRGRRAHGRVQPEGVGVHNTA